MTNSSGQSRDEAIDRRTLLAGAAVGLSAACLTTRRTAAREDDGARVYGPRLSARTSDVVVELLALERANEGRFLALRLTNVGESPVAVGPGMVRAILSTSDTIAVGSASDMCALAEGASTHLALTIPADAGTQIVAIDIGIVEAHRSGANIRLHLEPLRADARGGDAQSSVRTDSAGDDRRSPESFPACPY